MQVDSRKSKFNMNRGYSLIAVSILLSATCVLNAQNSYAQQPTSAAGRVAAPSNQSSASYPNWCFYLGISCNVDSHNRNDPAARIRLRQLSALLPEILPPAAMARVQRAAHLEQTLLPDLRRRRAIVQQEVQRLQGLVQSTPRSEAGAIAVFQRSLNEQESVLNNLNNQIIQAERELRFPPSKEQLGLSHIEGLVLIPASQRTAAGMPAGGAWFVPSCRSGYGPQQSGFIQIDAGSASDSPSDLARRLRSFIGATNNVAAIGSAVSSGLGITQIQ